MGLDLNGQLSLQPIKAAVRAAQQAALAIRETTNSSLTVWPPM